MTQPYPTNPNEPGLPHPPSTHEPHTQPIHPAVPEEPIHPAIPEPRPEVEPPQDPPS